MAYPRLRGSGDTKHRYASSKLELGEEEKEQILSSLDRAIISADGERIVWGYSTRD